MYITLTIETEKEQNDVQTDNRQTIESVAEILFSTGKTGVEPTEYYRSKLQKRLISASNTFLQENIQSGDVLTVVEKKKPARAEELLERNYLNSESQLGVDEHDYLVYPHPMLVDAKLEESEDGFKLIYDTTGLLPFDDLQKMKSSDRYRALSNAAKLERLSDEYAFSLDPDNLRLDINLGSKAVEREAANETSEPFIKQYMALIGSVLQQTYKFEDYMNGGSGLFEKHSVLKELSGFETVSDIQKELESLSAAAIKQQTKEFVQVKKRSLEIYKILVPILSGLTVAALIFAGYFLLFAKPFNDAIIEADKAYLRQNYLGVQDALEDIKVEDLPYETKYMLARSYVISEGLTNAQRENILSEMTMFTDERYFCFWIEVGRLNFESAQDYANRLNDSELLLFALAKQRQWVELDTKLSGTEKAELIAKLDAEIERLQKEIEEARGASGNSEIPSPLGNGEKSNDTDKSEEAENGESGDESTSDSTENGEAA